MSSPLLGELNPSFQKHVDPSSPQKLRLMVAKALVPMGPRDLLIALQILASSDPDDDVRQTAENKQRDLPENILKALSEPLPGEVLDAMAKALIRDADHLQTIALNKVTPDETMVFLATKTRQESLLEIIAANQERLLRHPPIIEALYLNAATRTSTVDRAVDFALMNNVKLEGIPAFKELLAARMGEKEAAREIVPEPEEETASLAIKELSKEKEPAEVDEKGKKLNLYQRIMQMSPAHKIRLATLGNKEARNLLMRDSNKLVQQAVIKSPAITENEVDQYSKNRSAPEDIIRLIANNREWTKNYQIKLNLVNNPKTPLPVALRFLTFLRQGDLKHLAKSKNVPSVLSQAAQKMLKRSS